MSQYYRVKYYQEYKEVGGGNCTTVVWDGMPEGNTGHLWQREGRVGGISKEAGVKHAHIPPCECVHVCSCMHTHTHGGMCVCVCACMHTHTCARTHTRTHKRTHTNAHTDTRAYTHTCTHTHTHTHAHTQMHMHSGPSMYPCTNGCSD